MKKTKNLGPLGCGTRIEIGTTGTTMKMTDPINNRRAPGRTSIQHGRAGAERPAQGTASIGSGTANRPNAQAASMSWSTQTRVFAVPTGEIDLSNH